VVVAVVEAGAVAALARGSGGGEVDDLDDEDEDVEDGPSSWGIVFCFPVALEDRWTVKGASMGMPDPGPSICGRRVGAGVEGGCCLIFCCCWCC
jgi:hypothetical protein